MKKLIIFFISLCFSCSAYANFQYAVDEYYKENYKAAFSEFQILAEQGDAIAQVYLALMYRSGNGVIENEALANAWDTKSLSGLKILASQGDPEAQFWFAETMSGDEAEIWYKK